MPADDRLGALLEDLNPPQREAVLHRDGPLLVLAGAGSGKTRVITRRAAYLVHTGVRPGNILAITFTNKAAAEMRARIEALGVGRGMWVYTFHALCARLMGEMPEAAGVAPGFSIYDEADQLRCVSEAMERCAVRPEHLRPEVVRYEIGAAKGRLWAPEDYAARADRADQRTTARVYEAYEAILGERNAVDFDDLLMRVALLLRRDEALADRLNQRFRYLLIDEYQDTNHAQYLIARHLSRAHRNLCATGDPDQSIYGWRGADLGNILEFERDYPEARVVRLEQNYRSTPEVLRVASGLIAGNRRRKPKELWTENAAGDPVEVWEFAEDRDEAERIAESIAGALRAGRAARDFAVFYRINALSRSIEDALRARGVPYEIARGVEFYNRKEIKDTVAYLRVLVNPADRVSLERILNTPPRGIGQRTQDRLRLAADEAGIPLIDVLRGVDRVDALRSAAARVRAFVELLDALRPLADRLPSQAVAEVLRLSGLEEALRAEHEQGGEDRLANVRELVNAAVRYEQEADQPTLVDFLARVSLTGDQDGIDESRGRVLLMTLHTAKGLEFPCVFIVGLEQGLLPHERAISQDGDVEEERRLCFVGITRARERLVLTYARQRLARGVVMPRSASQFLRELPRDALRWEHCAGAGTRDQTADPAPAWGTLRRSSPSAPPVAEFDDRASPWRLRRRRGRPDFDDEPAFSMNDPTMPPVQVEPHSQYADWKAGTIVRHERYGEGRVLWIRPGGAGATRAAIRFAGHGEKTFVLEKAPIRRA